MDHKLSLELSVIESLGEDEVNHEYGDLSLEVAYNHILEEVVVTGLTPKGYLGIEELESLLNDMKYIKGKQD